MKKDRGRNIKGKTITKCLMICMAVIIVFLACFQALPSKAEEKWTGVDENVIRKYASAYGRESSPPLINTDQGDLLLFLFLLAGTVGGFILGYCWRMLTKEKPSVLEVKKEDAR